MSLTQFLEAETLGAATKDIPRSPPGTCPTEILVTSFLLTAFLGFPHSASSSLKQVLGRTALILKT